MTLNFTFSSMQKLRLIQSSVAFIIAFGMALFPFFEASATEVEAFTTPGGIEVRMMETHELPFIVVQMAFEGGSLNDPTGKEGTANMLSALMNEGTEDMPSQAFRQAMDDATMQLYFKAHLEHFILSFKTLSAFKEQSFELLGKAISQPRFDPVDIERMRLQIGETVKFEQSQISIDADKKFLEALYPGSLIARPVSGDLETISSITREDIVQMYKKIFHRKNLKVVVVGDINRDEIGAYLDQALGSLQPGDSPPPAPKVAVNTSSPVVTTVYPGPQTEVRFGVQAMNTKDPDFMAAYIANHILGGGAFTSRLWQVVREKEGLSYGIDTSLNDYAGNAVLTGRAATSNENAQKLLDVLDKTITEFGESGPTDEEITRAKSFLAGNFALKFSSNMDIASSVLEFWLDDKDADYIDVRNDLLATVSPEDVRRATKRIFSNSVVYTLYGEPVISPSVQ